MAKEEKKPAGESPDDRVKRLLLEIFALVLFVFLLARFMSVYSVNGNILATIFSSLQSFGILDLLHKIFFYLVLVSIVLAIIFTIGIIYTSVRLREIQKIWQSMFNSVPVGEPEKVVKNEKWQRIISHINSSNSSDWRLAILECDIVLDELFDKLGYVGGTIGDKLKSVDPARFRTLDNAWEAHKIRNAIAHEGHDFSLTDREARRVIALYESVFKEFDFI